LPGIFVASMVMTSPPTSVQTSPVAAPTSSRSSAIPKGELRRTEVLVYGAHGDPGFRLLALDHLARDLSTHHRDRPLEVAHPGFPRVAADHLLQRVLGELDLALREPVLLELLGDEVLLGDVHLLVLGVSREVDDLHTVAQSGRDRIEQVRGRDEHDVG
jgi:hypothetical protein